MAKKTVFVAVKDAEMVVSISKAGIARYLKISVNSLNRRDFSILVVIKGWQIRELPLIGNKPRGKRS